MNIIEELIATILIILAIVGNYYLQYNMIPQYKLDDDVDKLLELYKIKSALMAFIVIWIAAILQTKYNSIILSASIAGLVTYALEF